MIRNFKLSVSILIFAVFQLTIGCATTSQKITPNKYQPTDPANITVLYEEPAWDYETIGYVRALQKTRWEKTDSLLERCRVEAAKFGADAIVVTNIGHETSLPGISAQAKAIKKIIARR